MLSGTPNSHRMIGIVASSFTSIGLLLTAMRVGKFQPGMMRLRSSGLGPVGLALKLPRHPASRRQSDTEHRVAAKIWH
jgi:hypothetical protein